MLTSEQLEEHRMLKDKTFEELYDEMLIAKDNYWRLNKEFTEAERIYREVNDAYLNKKLGEKNVNF